MILCYNMIVGSYSNEISIKNIDLGALSMNSAWCCAITLFLGLGGPWGRSSLIIFAWGRWAKNNKEINDVVVCGSYPPVEGSYFNE